MSSEGTAPEDVVRRRRVADEPVTDAQVAADRRRRRIVTAETRPSEVVLHPIHIHGINVRELSRHDSSIYMTVLQHKVRYEGTREEDVRLRTLYKRVL